MNTIIPLLALALLIGQPQKPPKFPEKRVVESWISAAQTVAQVSGNTQAKQIAQRLKEHYVLARPTAEGVTVAFRDTTDSLWVGIIIISQEQKMPNQRWQEVASSPIAAIYIPEANCIVIKEHGYATSNFTKGIVLLKEGYHAEKWLNREWDFNKPIPYYEDELEGFEFSKKLVSSIKGKPFIQLLESKVYLLKEALISGGILPPQDSVALETTPDLEQVFQISSPKEKQLWENYIFLMANLALADELSRPEKAIKVKIDVLKRIYPNPNE